MQMYLNAYVLFPKFEFRKGSQNYLHVFPWQNDVCCADCAASACYDWKLQE